MSDDIVTRLRAKYSGQLPICSEAADEIERLRASVINTFDNGFDEIERLRKLAHNLYEETKRCGSLHDAPATMDYEEWLEENE